MERCWCPHFRNHRSNGYTNEWKVSTELQSILFSCKLSINLRWNTYYPRCRQCFCTGLCYSYAIPCIYESEQVQWEDRCVICHTKKQHRSYYLCVGVYCMFNFITIIKPTIIPSIRVVRGGLLFCEPKPIRLIWLGYKCNGVCRV